MQSNDLPASPEIVHLPLVDDLLRGLKDNSSPEEQEQENDNPRGSDRG